MLDLDELQDKIDIRFRDTSLLELALIHRSYLNEHPEVPQLSNERLEFLGDALLELAITEMLYRQARLLTEGEMTRFRAALVCGDNLALVAEKLRLGDYLYLGRGEEESGGRKRQTNLANAMEALLGAVFVDRGFVVACAFVDRLLGAELKRVVAEGVTVDYKSQLQELLQAEKHITPVYRAIEAMDPDHNREFFVEVLLGDKVMGRGKGKNKQEAENEAARNALKARNI